MKLMVSPATREKLKELAQRMQSHAFEADFHAAKYKERREYLDNYMRANAANYGTAAQRRDKLGSDWALTDADNAYRWHRDEQNRLSNLIQAHVAMLTVCGSPQDEQAV